MALQQRSYSGELFRPRPEIHVEADGQLIIVATPWGPRGAAKRSIQIIRDYFHSVQQDDETTSPFSRMACLSSLANNLRIAVKLANDAICAEDNKSEFVSGIELFVSARKGSELAWVQIGYPYVMLDRPNRPLTPLGTQQDFSVEHSHLRQAHPPLPGKLLGLDMSSDFAVESLRTHSHDRFVLISRSAVPSSVYSLKSAERNIDEISKALSSDDAGLPYWLGILDFNSMAS